MFLETGAYVPQGRNAEDQYLPFQLTYEMLRFSNRIEWKANYDGNSWNTILDAIVEVIVR